MSQDGAINSADRSGAITQMNEKVYVITLDKGAHTQNREGMCKSMTPKQVAV